MYKYWAAYIYYDCYTDSYPPFTHSLDTFEHLVSKCTSQNVRCTNILNAVQQRVGIDGSVTTRISFLNFVFEAKRNDSKRVKLKDLRSGGHKRHDLLSVHEQKYQGIDFLPPSRRTKDER